MDTLQLQKDTFKTWFETNISRQSIIQQELVGQTLEKIFYTPTVEGWDINLKNQNVLHLPLGHLTFVTSSGKGYQINTNYQTWCGGVYGLMLDRDQSEENKSGPICPSINQLVLDKKWKTIEGVPIKKVDLHWKREPQCKLDRQILALKDVQKFLFEDSFVPESLIFHFENNEVLYVFALEPDEEIVDKQTYTLLNCGEELMIFFDEKDLKHWNINTIGFQIVPE